MVTEDESGGRYSTLALESICVHEGKILLYFSTQEVIAKYVREGGRVHMCLQKVFDSVDTV